MPLPRPCLETDSRLSICLSFSYDNFLSDSYLIYYQQQRFVCIFLFLSVNELGLIFL